MPTGAGGGAAKPFMCGGGGGGAGAACSRAFGISAGHRSREYLLSHRELTGSGRIADKGPAAGQTQRGMA